MTDWINKNKGVIIRLAFLVPIILVAIISISHVISWYNLANPISWAIYLSIAIEIAAMSSIAAASVKVKGFSVWFVFIIVTLIQFIGNIYFCYAEINIESEGFKQWMELTKPLFEMMGSEANDVLAQKRWLALLEGGLLPLISLTCLHFFIQYEDKKPIVEPEKEIKIDNIEEEPKQESESLVEEIVTVEEPAELGIEEPVVEEIAEETAVLEAIAPLEVEKGSDLDIAIENLKEVIEEVEEQIEKKTN